MKEELYEKINPKLNYALSVLLLVRHEHPDVMKAHQKLIEVCDAIDEAINES